MNIFHAILLGIVQGLTEFLPISSTAHLTLAGKALGLIDPSHPEVWTAFIAVMQLGTLFAVVVYFWKDIFGMTGAVISDVGARLNGNRKPMSGGTILALWIIVGTMPVGLAGVFLSDVIRGMFTKSTMVIVASLVTLAAILWLAEKVARHHRTIEHVTWKDALVIGVAQACALIPGSSRSGTTITAGLFLGLTREAAARFSFLLSIPAVLASAVYEIKDIDPSVFTLGIPNLTIATLVSGISGYAAIAWLLRFLWKHTTMIFVWYRFALGLALSIMLLAGIIDP